MKQIKIKILENRKIAQGFYKMRLESKSLAKNSKPGQFFEVRCSDSSDPLLRRPLGLHRIFKNGIELLYEIIGKGTVLLSQKKAGESLDIIGPLGNGFDLAPCPLPLAPILIAGGIGVAPLVALAEELRRRRKEVKVIIGAKTKSHLLCENEFKSLGCGVKVATEDGSKGKKGLATDMLKTLLSTINCELSTLYACGPNAMLKEVTLLAKKKNVPCQVSLEEYMACGVGVCLGCPVKVKVAKTQGHKDTSYEYKMVCKDGPVFNAEEILW